VLRVHLAKAFGDKRLDEISTEDVQRLKAAHVERAQSLKEIGGGGGSRTAQQARLPTS
jgi:hypothetical protein